MIDAFVLVFNVLLVVGGISMVYRAYRDRRNPTVHYGVRHVGMFTDAQPGCGYCHGTGWRRDHQERCMSACSCVPDDVTTEANA